MAYSKDLLLILRSSKSVASIDKLVRIVAQLCTKIFHFLLPYLRWNQSNWERLKGSVDKNYYEKNIQGPLDEILKLSKQLTREAGLQISRVNLRTEALSGQAVQTGAENLAVGAENLAVSKKILQTMVQKRQQTNRFDNLSDIERMSLLSQFGIKLAAGLSGKAMLVSTVEQTNYDHMVGYSTNPQVTLKSQVSDTTLSEVTVQQRRFEYTFAEVEISSRCMGTFQTGFSADGVQALQKTAKSVLEPLQEWLSASESRTLWVYGPANASIPSDLSSTAEYVVSTITSVHLPLIAHRCRPEETEIEALISMVYSLIFQLVWQLPNSFTTHRIFDSSRFVVLDRSIRTLDQALILMEDLLAEVPRLLVCVLDGVQMAEDGREDVRGTGMFLDLFLEVLKESKESKILKILLTTDGFCHRLHRRLSSEEQVDAMNDAEQFAGQRKRGRVALTNLALLGD